jgi:hypothetical protein
MSTRHQLSRRDLLLSSAAWAAAGVIGQGRPTFAEATASDQHSRVVLIRHPDVVAEDGGLDGAILHDMLNRAVERLLATDTSQAAWKQLVGDADVVGVKSNVWRRLPTPRELEAALRTEMIAAGVAAKNTAIDDRGVRTNPVFKRMLDSDSGAMINVRPMRTHHWSGLGTCLKNPIMFVPRPADYHDDACASIGAFWKELGLREKTKLNILVMLTPQFHGVGPHSFSERFVWQYKGLIVGTDPVAVDATGARIIEAKRREFFGEDRPISQPPHHIRYAETRYQLGVSDPERIDIDRMGWQTGSLI